MIRFFFLYLTVISFTFAQDILVYSRVDKSFFTMLLKEQLLHLMPNLVKNSLTLPPVTLSLPNKLIPDLQVLLDMEHLDYDLDPNGILISDIKEISSDSSYQKFAVDLKLSSISLTAKEIKLRHAESTCEQLSSMDSSELNKRLTTPNSSNLIPLDLNKAPDRLIFLKQLCAKLETLNLSPENPLALHLELDLTKDENQLLSLKFNANDSRIVLPSLTPKDLSLKQLKIEGVDAVGIPNNNLTLFFDQSHLTAIVTKEEILAPLLAKLNVALNAQLKAAGSSIAALNKPYALSWEYSLPELFSAKASVTSVHVKNGVLKTSVDVEMKSDNKEQSSLVNSYPAPPFDHPDLNGASNPAGADIIISLSEQLFNKALVQAQTSMAEKLTSMGLTIKDMDIALGGIEQWHHYPQGLRTRIGEHQDLEMLENGFFFYGCLGVKSTKKGLTKKLMERIAGKENDHNIGIPILAYSRLIFTKDEYGVPMVSFSAERLENSKEFMEMEKLACSPSAYLKKSIQKVVRKKIEKLYNLSKSAKSPLVSIKIPYLKGIDQNLLRLHVNKQSHRLDLLINASCASDVKTLIEQFNHEENSISVYVNGDQYKQK
jgi:hypothetical protein